LACSPLIEHLLIPSNLFFRLWLDTCPPNVD
jgi:hypothetical protein